MNRHSIFVSAAFAVLAIILLGGVVSTQEARNPNAAALKNPVAATPESLAAGKRAYDANCAACHGNRAQGAERAGVVISIIQEMGGKQAPDLTDDKWDHGSTDGEIYTVTKKGVPPTMMAGGRADSRTPRSGASSTTFERSRRTRMLRSRLRPRLPRRLRHERDWSWRITSRCRSLANPAERTHAVCWRG